MARTKIVPSTLPGGFSPSTLLVASQLLDNTNGNECFLGQGNVGVILVFSGDGVVTLNGAVNPVTGTRFITDMTIGPDVPLLVGPLNAAVWGYDEQLNVRIDSSGTVGVDAFSY
jgi:hypothetical protein